MKIPASALTAERPTSGGWAIFEADFVVDGDDIVPGISPGEQGRVNQPARKPRALAERRRFPNRRSGDERRIGDRRLIFLPVSYDRRVGIDRRGFDDRRRRLDRRSWIERRTRIGP